MLKDLLKFIVKIIAKIHDKILSINDGQSFGLNDKQLHLLVIGIVGLGLFLCVNAVFKWLAKRSITAISWIYTFTLIVVITFAIEIGQYASNTGSMSFGDIAYGIWGFLLFFLIYLVVHIINKARNEARNEARKKNSRYNDRYNRYE